MLLSEADAIEQDRVGPPVPGGRHGLVGEGSRQLIPPFEV